MKRLSWQTKNKVLIGGAVVLLLMSWPLALRKTWDAISFHKDLVSKVQASGDLSFNPQYLKEKHAVLSKTAATYTADSSAWANDFWLKASGAASGRGILVTYTPQKAKTDIDTASSRVLRNTISFSAGYGKLVALLDTLERIDNVGLITSATFQRMRNLNAEGGEKLHLRAVFSVVKKE